MSSRNSRCMLHATLYDFLKHDAKSILGTIVSSFHGDAQTTTISAWEGEINVLQKELLPWKDEDAYIVFEYDIPRLGKRIDVVLLLKGFLFCIEFKVGQNEALQADVEQVLDYALDLKNFHKYSENLPIVPVLIPTAYTKPCNAILASPYSNQIYNPLIVGADGLQGLIQKIVDGHTGTIDPLVWGCKWIISPYSPTPTIIEAARALYENHSVEDITKHEADKVSTDAAIAYVQKIIDDTKSRIGA